MIDALVSGRVYQKPAERTSKAGKRFAVAKVRAPMREGETAFVNVICFNATAIAALLALEDGDGVALSGELTVKVYAPPSGEPRPSLDLLAHAVLTEYHVVRKRKAMLPEPSQDRSFNDELPDLVGQR